MARFTIGDRFETNDCGFVTLIDKIRRKGKSTLYCVSFDSTGTIIPLQAPSSIRRGAVSDPMAPIVYGVGCLGLGKYTPTKDSKHTEEYNAWIGMLARCYGGDVRDYVKRNYKDKGVYVDSRWHNFQEFAGWFTVNRKRNGYHLDKDIISPNSRVYSPETCTVIPQPLNKLLSIYKHHRDKSLPVAVVKHAVKSDGTQMYAANCSDHFTGKVKKVGYGDDPHQVFLQYKDFKEGQIRICANEYFSRDEIDERTRDALLTIRIGETSLYRD